MLNSVLEENPQFKKCLTRCVDCQIEFLTDPRNAGRKDLRCPFGCRVEHRRRESNRRVKEYYQGKTGKKIKCELNQRRKEKKLAKGPKEPGIHNNVESTPDKKPSKDMVKYLMMLAGLLENRLVTPEEIYTIIRKKMRQHRIAKMRKVCYNIDYLIKNPP